jgi:hypothetical protein
MRVNWTPVMEEAARIVSSYDTPPTLRQVFYRLVAAAHISNTESAYKILSDKTAKGRRDGSFPPLSDGTRRISKPVSYRDATHALDTLAERFRLDRVSTQTSQLWLFLEKSTLETIALSAVHDFGVPVVAVRGYGSQTILDDAKRAMLLDGRPVEVLYVGDFDPSGVDIDRDIKKRLGLDFPFTRIAVTEDQITDLDLTPMPGKTTDSRAAGFVSEYGALFQVEAEAIDPAGLETMIRSAVEDALDLEAIREVMDAEEAELSVLRRLIP